MHKFRIFLSYCRKDLESVERIAEVLRSIGLEPIWDRNIHPGTVFSDETKGKIATAHLLMPVLTVNTQGSPWVHQEIGFAIGISIPVLPLSFGSLPGQMIAGIQALCFKQDFSDLGTQLSSLDIMSLVIPKIFEPELERLGVSNHVAASPEERTRNLINFAQAVPVTGRVRQRVIFSSFSLPKADPQDPAWDAVDSPRRRDESYRRLLRKEREVLEHHTRQSGCSLLLHLFATSPSDVSAQRGRIRLLIDFIRSMPDRMIRVAITKAEMQDSLILVGDWFGARASPPRDQSDYRQTFFCRHAPTVLRWCRDFDHRVEEVLAASGISARNSRATAIEQLDARLQDLLRLE